MSTSANILIVGISLVTALTGCAAHRTTGVTPHVSAAAPLQPGETIEVDYSSLGLYADPQQLHFTIDASGFVNLPHDQSVFVKDLTPAEAGKAITAAYVPRYFRQGEIRVLRVDPGATQAER